MPTLLISPLKLSMIAGVKRGMGRLPVADYSLAVQVMNNLNHKNKDQLQSEISLDEGIIDVDPSNRGVYSFCMCPGGQVCKSKPTLNDDRLNDNNILF